jgi:hypothetical protein
MELLDGNVLVGEKNLEVLTASRTAMLSLKNQGYMLLVKHF